LPTRLPAAAKTAAKRAVNTPAWGPQISSRPFEISCAAIGLVTIGLAVFIDLFCNDQTGAALILLMASVLIGLLRGHSRRRKE
jgi:hypothetical protein